MSEVDRGMAATAKLIAAANAAPASSRTSFRNVSDVPGRLLVMIVPETDEQADPISYAPSLAKEIETEYGKSALEGLQKVGFKFEEPVT